MSTTEIRPGGQLFSVMDHTLQMRAGLSQSVHFPLLAQGVSAKNALKLFFLRDVKVCWTRASVMTISPFGALG